MTPKLSLVLVLAVTACGSTTYETVDEVREPEAGSDAAVDGPTMAVDAGMDVVSPSPDSGSTADTGTPVDSASPDACTTCSDGGKCISLETDTSNGGGCGVTCPGAGEPTGDVCTLSHCVTPPACVVITTSGTTV